MKKLIALSLCALTVLSLAACGSGSKATKAPESGSAPATHTAEMEQIPNPFVDCATIKDAAKLAGFDFIAPLTVDGYPDSQIQAIEGRLIQVIFMNGDKELIIRKCIGSEDISGDYTQYSENKTITIGNAEIATKGNDGKIFTATWTNGDYCYAVVSSNGIDEAALTVIIENTDPTGDETMTQMINPFVDCKTIDDAQKLAGFELTYPANAAGRSPFLIQAISGKLIQVFYGDTEKEILVRKGVEFEDISGDYNVYSEEKVLSVGALNVTAKGENGDISVATWTNDGYAYSIGMTGMTLTSAELTALVEAIN